MNFAFCMARMLVCSWPYCYVTRVLCLVWDLDEDRMVAFPLFSRSVFFSFFLARLPSWTKAVHLRLCRGPTLLMLSTLMPSAKVHSQVVTQRLASKDLEQSKRWRSSTCSRTASNLSIVEVYKRKQMPIYL